MSVKPNGYILWEGKSKLDKAPIVMIGTGYANPSTNVKTGGMIQTWILRADMPPVEAIKTGADASICGDCVLRGVNGKERGCYVNVYWAPGRIYETYRRGGYPKVGPAAITALHAGRVVRLGAYGDPAAVPVHRLRRITAAAESWTGYTHQWARTELQDLCMASVETAEQGAHARLRGYRTFRGLESVEARGAGEILCPASKEAGHKTTCEKCTLCDGSRTDAGLHRPGEGGQVDGGQVRRDPRKHIAIVVHGAGAKWAAKEVAA